MTSLDISNNNIGQLVLPEGWSEPNPGNPDILDYRFQHEDGRHQAESPEGSSPDGAVALADAIKNNEAMAKFTFCGMVEGLGGAPVTIETSMTEADFSKKTLGTSGAIMLAAFLPKCQ